MEELTNLRDELQASQKVQAQDKKTIHRIRNEMDEHAKNIGTLESTIKLLQRDKIESMELLKVAHMNESRMLIQERELRECRKNEKALQMHNERSSKLVGYWMRWPIFEICCGSWSDCRMSIRWRRVRVIILSIEIRK